MSAGRSEAPVRNDQCVLVQNSVWACAV